nr:CRISPR-associated endonuclease Cas1 [Streptomyces sp. LUP30]
MKAHSAKGYPPEDLAAVRPRDCPLSRRPSTDPVNAARSFTYGLLRSLVHGALEQVGLDPYLGFLHMPEPKPSS